MRTHAGKQIFCHRHHLLHLSSSTFKHLYLPSFLLYSPALEPFFLTQWNNIEHVLLMLHDAFSFTVASQFQRKKIVAETQRECEGALSLISVSVQWVTDTVLRWRSFLHKWKSHTHKIERLLLEFNSPLEEISARLQGRTDNQSLAALAQQDCIAS